MKSKDPQYYAIVCEEYIGIEDEFGRSDGIIAIIAGRKEAKESLKYWQTHRSHEHYFMKSYKFEELSDYKKRVSQMKAEDKQFAD